MKKILLILFTGISIVMLSQNTILVTNITGGGTITPNQIINVITSANNQTKVTFDIKNTSTSTKTYNAKRYDVILNSGASAYFCFAGTCYGNSVLISQTPIILNANQSASQISGSFNILEADLDEGSTVGLSVIKYTFINTTNSSDSVQFTLRYNSPNVGLAENSNSISSIDAYPNPASDFTSFKINSKANSDAKFEVFNSLGALISSKNIILSEGKNKVDYNVESLAAGIYFASIKVGNSTTTKKFIVK